jgi:hypothetical protein
MSNPRNRNQVNQSPWATTEAKLPPIPVVRTGQKAIDDFCQAVKTKLEIRDGGRNVYEKWMTKRDLAEIGLYPSPPNHTIPPNTDGIMVRITPGKYVALTLQGLETALAALRAKVEEDPPASTGGGTDTSKFVTRSEMTTELSALEKKLREAINAIVIPKSPSLSDFEVLRRQVQLLQQGYDYIKVVADDVWVINHEMNTRPVVIVLNDAGEKIEQDVEYTDLNTVTITHGSAITGRAVLY